MDDHFAEEVSNVETSVPRVAQATTDVANEVASEANKVAGEVAENDIMEPLLDDFSPQTMEELDDVMKKAEDVSNMKKAEVSSEVALKVAVVADVAPMLDDVSPKTMEEIEDAIQKAVDGSKVVVLRNSSDMSCLDNITPAVPKRAIKIPSYLQSPFLQNFGSSSYQSTDPEVPAQIKTLKHIFPLDDKIGELPDKELCTEYYNWLENGVLMKKNKSKFYSKEDNTISPPLKLGNELISEKMWFHTIEYGSNTLSNSHVDVFFHYLRKAPKYNPKCQMKFTSTDSMFQKKYIAMLAKVSQSDNIESGKHDIIEVIKGRGMSCNTPWCLVDFVLLPTWLPEEKHWLLATLSFHDWAILVSNTLVSDDAELIIKKALLPFCKLLPQYLLLTEFYGRTDMDFSSKCYSEKSKTDYFRLIIYNDYPRATPIHNGIYMLSIAEYFVMQKEFPKDSFGLEFHRSRIAFSFYSYAMAKQIYGYDSESESVNHGAVHGKVLPKRSSPKRRKVITRKRKATRDSPVKPKNSPKSKKVVRK